MKFVLALANVEVLYRVRYLLSTLVLRTALILGLSSNEQLSILYHVYVNEDQTNFSLQMSTYDLAINGKFTGFTNLTVHNVGLH